MRTSMDFPPRSRADLRRRREALLPSCDRADIGESISMKRRRIGRTSLDVTEIGLGGAGYRRPVQGSDPQQCGKTFRCRLGSRYSLFRYCSVLRIRPVRAANGRIFAQTIRATPMCCPQRWEGSCRAVPGDQVPDYSYVEPLPFAVDYDYSATTGSCGPSNSAWRALA